jgi:FkbM family methyltransferase
VKDRSGEYIMAAASSQAKSSSIIDSSPQSTAGFVRTGGHQRVQFFFLIAIINAAILISLGMFGSFTSCDQYAVTASSIVRSPAAATAAAGASDGMTALDRRMLKYFQSYFYVPPVPSDTLRRDFPGKELLTRKSLRDKICGAAPAFDEYFQLTLNERSANNEDKWIYENLFKGKRNESMGNNVQGTFVEIGAYNGMDESNSRFFEVCLGWEGLLVEGQPGNYQRLLRNRPFAHKMSFAPSCDAEYEKVNKTIQFANYPFTNSGLKGHAKSYDTKLHVDVPCGPFSPVLEDIFAFSNKRINFFSLDVEGAENLVLKTMDFSKVMIDVIMIESWNNHCQNNCEVREQVRQKMAAEGFLRYEGLIPKSDIHIHPNSTYQLPATFKAANV